MDEHKSPYDVAADIIRSRSGHRPRIGLVLGSGLGNLADALESRDVVSSHDLPGWPRSTVEGHSGNLVLGMLEGQTVVAQQGRVHFYEGYTTQQIVFPVRVMSRLGIEILVLTNAAGGLRPDWQTGDLMMLNDHINLPGMSGANPLTGPNDESFGPRFPGMSQAYDRDLRRRALRVADEAGITLHEGVYVCVSGPNFETPAEIRMLRTMGADAVGMSTAHEVVVARHAGIRVLACSGITNVAIDEVNSDQEASHEEVLEAGAQLVPRLTTVLRGVLRGLA
ncbi:MAG: purine-nucleoside phosphorylase [Anaerolineaceae bacterium]|nr:purine-nucleoside phosphorylase [Anaerolineaceae bacterium]MDE0329377.1 purine-nucleoside phosphorylase [Anaerolineaceae bacterium]